MTMKLKIEEPRLPITLKLLPGLRWRGKLKVLQRVPDGYVVAFDAEDQRSTHERYVYDQTFLTAAELKAWTGVDLPRPTLSEGDGNG